MPTRTFWILANVMIRNNASFTDVFWEYNIFKCVLFVKCVDIYVLRKLDVDKGNRENCGRQGTLGCCGENMSNNHTVTGELVNK